ncbi:hypothetical protein GEMRC1_012049 [Eukaryota sp. GEM-RC1]
MNPYLAYTVAAAALFLTAYIPSPAMKNVHTEWYQCIKLPITPPNAVFPIVWTILYVILAILLGRVLTMPSSRERTKTIYIFAANLVLNILWTYTFFGLGFLFLGYFIILLLIALGIWLLLQLNTLFDTENTYYKNQVRLLCYSVSCLDILC